VHLRRVPREPGGLVDAADVVRGGRHLQAAQVGAAEADPEVGRGGPKGQRDLASRMESDTSAGGRSAKCPLYAHWPVSSLGVTRSVATRVPRLVRWRRFDAKPVRRSG